MKFRCESCQKFIPAALEKRPIQVGDKVSFTNTTQNGRGVIRMAAKAGVVLEVREHSAVVKVPRWQPHVVHLDRLTHQDMPSCLTVAFIGLCECNTTESQKEAQQ
jgi:hypothetical protein